MHVIFQALAQFTESERLRVELTALVEQKHTECVKYHTQLQTVLVEKEEQSILLTAYAEKLPILEQELKKYD